jgi:hypothetical protein
MNNTQYNNLVALNTLFTEKNFETYLHNRGLPVQYNNTYWERSIGGFAAFHQIGGLSACSQNHTPVLIEKYSKSNSYGALDKVFGINSIKDFCYDMDESPDFQTVKERLEKMVEDYRWVGADDSEGTTVDEMVAPVTIDEILNAVDSTLNDDINFINYTLKNSESYKQLHGIQSFTSSKSTTPMDIIVELFTKAGHKVYINHDKSEILFIQCKGNLT